MKGGSIKHNITGVELTAEGKFSLPATGAMLVGGKTFITSGKIVTDFIDVDNLKVKKLDGATGTFKELQAVDNNGKIQGKMFGAAFGPASLQKRFTYPAGKPRRGVLCLP